MWNSIRSVKPIDMILGGLGLQGLGAGLGFPARGWPGSWRGKRHTLATRPVASDKGPGPSALQKGISTKTGSSEGSQIFIKREKMYSTCG